MVLYNNQTQPFLFVSIFLKTKFIAMKNVLLILFSLVLVNCNPNDDKGSYEGIQELLGKWKLIEQLSDPGDGSGVFNPIDSNKEIEFFSNGTMTVNGVLCYMSSEVGEQNSGSFSVLENNDYYDGEIIPNDCDYAETKLYFKIEGSNLIIWYLCIEGCGQKFVKIKK